MDVTGGPLLPRWSFEAPHSDREQRFVRKEGILRTKKSTSGLYVFVLWLSYFLFSLALNIDWLPYTMLAVELSRLVGSHVFDLGPFTTEFMKGLHYGLEV